MVKGSQITTLKIVTLIAHLVVFCLHIHHISMHAPSVPDFNTIWFVNIIYVFKIHIVFKSGTLGVCKQNTYRCSISVAIFSVVIWDPFFFAVLYLSLFTNISDQFLQHVKFIWPRSIMDYISLQYSCKKAAYSDMDDHIPERDHF